MSVDEGWLQWQREDHLPAIMATGCFTSFQILHLLEHDDSEGKTYAVQLTANTAEDCDFYSRTHAPSMRQQAIEKWGNKIISFHSLLQVIH